MLRVMQHGLPDQSRCWGVLEFGGFEELLRGDKALVMVRGRMRRMTERKCSGGCEGLGMLLGEKKDLERWKR